MENLGNPTLAQIKALAHYYERQKEDGNFKDFLDYCRAASPIIGGDGAITVPFFSMWLAIEPDGLTHS